MSQSEDGAQRAAQKPAVPAQPQPAPQPAAAQPTATQPAAVSAAAEPVPVPGPGATQPVATAATAVRLGAPSPERSEATRLLCAGTYIDPQFQRRVIEELVEHQERTVAPSLGVDAVSVLGHALRCRRREVQTALWLLLLWGLFFAFGIMEDTKAPYEVLWPVAYVTACVYLWVAHAVSGRTPGVYATDRRVDAPRLPKWRTRLGWVLRVMARWQMLIYWNAALAVLAIGTWIAVVFPLLMMWPVWAHRAWCDRVMREELNRQAFRTATRPELPTACYRIARAIDEEQYSRLTVYDFQRPFIGYGTPYEPWSLAIELKRRKDVGVGDTALTGRKVIELILPRLAALRDSAAAGSRDRLKDLEVAHLAYLPPPPQRDDVDRDQPSVDRHVGGSIDEGGEARRYFLRVRVGGWSEQVVVTILVRVHTQGGMLVLEVVPHVLTPVRPEYRAVDVVALRGNGFRGFVRALLSAPSASVAAGISAGRTAASVFRTWLADAAQLPAEGPAASVRELGAVGDPSLFQEMDASRYVKTVQDRVTSGVTEALRVCGYETGEFEQHIININEGGVFIGAMSGGAVAAGQGASASSQSGGGS